MPFRSTKDSHACLCWSTAVPLAGIQKVSPWLRFQGSHQLDGLSSLEVWGTCQMARGAERKSRPDWDLEGQGLRVTDALPVQGHA